MGRVNAPADDPESFADLVPVVEALVGAGNELRDGGFVLSPDGWRCRLLAPLDFARIRERCDLPATVQLSPEHDTVLDTLTWCSIEGPGASTGQGWPGSLEFLPMTTTVAQEIADTWHYPEPYDFYDQTADPDDYAEFVTGADWPTHVWQVRSRGRLVGFFSADIDGATCEIALGLRPSLTGAGRGLAFLRAGLARLAPLLPPDCEVVLSVAEFNQRAIRVYQRAGFVVTSHFDQDTNASTFPFVAMALSRSE